MVPRTDIEPQIELGKVIMGLPGFNSSLPFRLDDKFGTAVAASDQIFRRLDERV